MSDFGKELSDVTYLDACKSACLQDCACLAVTWIPEISLLKEGAKCIALTEGDQLY